MHLLDAVTHSPNLTQRALAKRIGIALGLTNLMLRRLATKGYIKIVNVQKSRLSYLITPQGVLEKARLTREYIQCSLFLYRNVRGLLRRRLAQWATTGRQRVLLCGTGELAEIAFLTIQELGLELVGVVEDPPARERFLGLRVHAIERWTAASYDLLIVTSLQSGRHAIHHCVISGLPAERIIVLPSHDLQGQPLLDIADVVSPAVPAEMSVEPERVTVDASAPLA